MKIQVITKYINDEAELRFAFYGDGTTSLELIAGSGLRITVATVCLAGYDLAPPSPSHVFLKCDGPNLGLWDCLISAGVLDRTPLAFAMLPDGTHYPLCKLTPEADAFRALSHLDASSSAPN